MGIRLVKVHKSFGDKQVLRGFTLDVADGETAVILGPSGSGKSVLLRHVVGLMHPDEGRVLVNGAVVARLARAGLRRLRHDIGYVFQFAALFDSMTIAENVGMGLRRIPGWDRGRIADRVQECLALVELDGFGERYPAQLSGGQRKRAGLARAIAPSPQYLLYDEPTTGLDPVTTSVIDRLILRMRDEFGVTGLVVTHDMTSAFRVADRITLLHDGKARFTGTPAEVNAATDPIVAGFVRGDPALYHGDGAGHETTDARGLYNGS